MKTRIIFSLFLLLLLVGCTGTPEEKIAPEKLKVSSWNDLRIRQRETTSIKGTGGDLSVFVGDITHGACLVEITGNQKGQDVVYLSRSLREHDSATFAYYDRYYRVFIQGFELHFIHDDFAFITIREVTKEEAKADPKGISKKRPAKDRFTPEEALESLSQIEKSNCQFIRDGKSYNGKDFFGFLAAKCAMNDQQIETKADFQQFVLSRTVATDEPYKVVCEKGDTLLLKDWMRW